MKRKLLVICFLSLVIVMIFGLNSTFGYSSRFLAQEAINGNQLTPSPFNDIDGHWSQAFIVEMNFRGIMNGYNDSTFKPNNPVTQLEALVMLVRMMGYDPDSYQGENQYLLKDVFKVPGWAIPYVNFALEKQIVYYKEMERMTFNQPLIRQDAAVFVTRTLIAGAPADDRTIANELKSEAFELQYADIDSIDPDLKKFVALVTRKGIINGTTTGHFYPTNPLSRAEISVILMQTYKHLTPQQDITIIQGTLKNARTEAAQSGFLTVQTGTMEENVTVPLDSLVYKNNVRSQITNLTSADNITILVKGEDSKTWLIMATSPPESNTLAFTKVNTLTAGLEEIVTKYKTTQGFYAFTVNKELYFLACLGEKPTSGYLVDITQVHRTDLNTTVSYTTTNPPRDAFVNPKVGYPYSLVKLTDPNIKPDKVLFIDSATGKEQSSRVEHL